jgi:hypothetical protein
MLPLQQLVDGSALLVQFNVKEVGAEVPTAREGRGDGWDEGWDDGRDFGR